MWCCRRMEKIKWPEKVINEEVLERIRVKRELLDNILRIKASWVGQIQRRNCLLHGTIEGRIAEWIEWMEKERSSLVY